MKTITKSLELKEFCDRATNEKYITIDTEFLRERTYFSKLCLVQLATQVKNENAVIVDTLVNLDLSPLYEIFKNQIGYIHAASGFGNFYLASGIFHILFDTQISYGVWVWRSSL